MCFVLASYNGGYGHLLDARRLAAEMELDPDKWFNNVEHSMALLSKQEYAERAKYGWCKSDIIVNYVNEIMLRYHHYNQLISKKENQ